MYSFSLVIIYVFLTRYFGCAFLMRNGGSIEYANVASLRSFLM